MKSGYTHIAIVLDRSGSMASCADDTVGGFNKFIEDQKRVPGEATLTLTQLRHPDQGCDAAGISAACAYGATGCDR
jgi:hypothetical protein